MGHLPIVGLILAGGLIAVFLVGRILRASSWMKGRYARKESIDWQSTREWQGEAKRRMQSSRTPPPPPPPEA
jgi:hypothetical protein